MKNPTPTRQNRSAIPGVLLLGFTTFLFTAAHVYGQCELYPIALSAQQLSGTAPGSILNNTSNGSQPGSFGWLTWGGSPSEPTLVASLMPPGDSSTYVNPDDPQDHQIAVGKWISAKPGVSNSKPIRDALDVLKAMDILVPVWDQARGSGERAAYRVAGFARVRLIDYNLPGQNRITARFLEALNR